MKQEEEQQQDPETDNLMPVLDTILIVLKVFKELGIEARANDDGSITAYCEGLNVNMEFSDGYVRFWDGVFYSIEQGDPIVPLVHLAVNDTNYCFGPTVIMMAVNKGRHIGLYSRFDIALHKDFPNNTDLIKVVLESFHNTRKVFEDRLEEHINRQTKEQQNRRPVGFTISDAE